MNRSALADELRPEERLLLCCARTVLDQECAEAARTCLQAPIDWERLVRLAQEHRVVPLLFTNLGSSFSDLVPQPALEQLRRQSVTNARRNLFLTGVLVRQVSLLEAHGIRAVPFKGPVLADAFYGNLSLRQFGDLDIYIPPSQIHEAVSLLKAQDYVLPHVWLDEHYRPREAARLASVCAHNSSLWRREGQIVIELHWRLSPAYFDLALDLVRLYDRLHRVSLAGKPVRSFPPEELLMYLCVHGAKHRWERLSWICDIAEGVRNTRLDWERMLREAGKLGCERALALGLVLAKTLLGAPVPEETLRRLPSGSTVRGLVADVRRRLFRDVNAPPSFGERGVTVEQISLNSVSFHLRARERWRDRLIYCRYVLLFLVTPTLMEQKFVPLPAALSFLYYVLAPIQNAGKFLIRAVQACLPKRGMVEERNLTS